MAKSHNTQRNSFNALQSQSDGHHAVSRLEEHKQHTPRRRGKKADK